jgi:hypothetical protein
MELNVRQSDAETRKTSKGHLGIGFIFSANFSMSPIISKRYWLI